MPASGASLLLNAEAVFTALLAWFAFKENFDRRIAIGMALIVFGAVVLTWPGATRFGGVRPTLAILGACFAWAVDNNLTRKVSLDDATWIASVNLSIALSLGARPPPTMQICGAMGVGFVAYGMSLALFVVALQRLGTARTGAYFSVAPFFGAVLGVLLGDALTTSLIAAGALMAAGVWLHLTERHEHEHLHEPMEHTHRHVHDEHHRHVHDASWDGKEPHTHLHRHERLQHSHPHYPDAHHRH
jgi:drug/metabolite transporter (DMT)-like permease